MSASEKPTAGAPQNGGYVIIDPPNDLMAKVEIAPDDEKGPGAVERAERALDELSQEFDQWMAEETAVLRNAFAAIKQQGLVEPHAERLFMAAHDLKGQAATLGYPLIGRYCGLLCEMFYATDDRSSIPVHVVKMHIDAVGMCLREAIRDKENNDANQAFERLDVVVRNYCDGRKARTGGAGKQTQGPTR
jgi:chemotaxis protein histidine kinase CheA